MAAHISTIHGILIDEPNRMPLCLLDSQLGDIKLEHVAPDSRFLAESIYVILKFLRTPM